MLLCPCFDQSPLWLDLRETLVSLHIDKKLFISIIIRLHHWSLFIL